MPVGAAFLLVSGLQPHTQYQFSVLAQNKLGSGPFSEIVLSAPEGERSLTQSSRQGWGRAAGKVQIWAVWMGVARRVCGR